MSENRLHPTRGAAVPRAYRHGRALRLALLLTMFTAGGTAAGTGPAALHLRTPAVAYGADMRITAGSLTLTGRVNYTPERERRTLKLEGSDVPAQPMIVRRDRNVVWILNPARQSYYRLPASAGVAASDGFLSQTLTEKTEVGRETLDGIEVTKYRVALTDARGIRFTGHVWITRDEILLKVEGETFNAQLDRTRRLEIVLSKLEVGPQPVALFEVPPGYTQVSPSHPTLGVMAPPPRPAGKRRRRAGAPAGGAAGPARP